jgi:hypothetical protein
MDLSLPLPASSLVLKRDCQTVSTARCALVDAVVDKADVLADVDRLFRSFVVGEV